MLLVLLMITPAIVGEVMWRVILWAPFRLTKTRLLVVSGAMSMVILGALVIAVRALGHAVTSAGMLS